MRRSRIRKLPSTELPQGSDERSTEPWDIFAWGYPPISILIDNLNLITHMSSQTVDLSHCPPLAGRAFFEMAKYR